MQYTQAIILLASAVGLATAAPAASEARGFRAQLTFTGAADGSYSYSAPADGSVFNPGNDLSVSKITLAGGATCTLHGVDGGVFTVVGANTVDVGPPQTITWGTCWAL